MEHQLGNEMEPDMETGMIAIPWALLPKDSLKLHQLDPNFSKSRFPKAPSNPLPSGAFNHKPDTLIIFGWRAGQT